MSQRTVVAIGCSTVPDYAFLIPLTSLMWREVAGFETFTVLVGDSRWVREPALVVVANAMFDHLGGNHFTIATLPQYPEGTVAQNIRQHAAQNIKFADDTWIMTADADLWPLRGSFYQAHVDTDKRAVIYYSNGDHFQGKRDVLAKFDAAVPVPFQSIPTCHVAMRAKTWREVYAITPGELTKSTKKTLDGMEPWLSRFAPEHQGLARWCCDQWYLTERLCRQEWFPEFDMPKSPTPPQGRVLQSEHVALIERYGHPPVDRLDRGAPQAWMQAFDKNRYVDAHLHKAPWEDAQWKTLLKIIDVLLPKHSEWARQYRENFVRAL